MSFSKWQFSYLAQRWSSQAGIVQLMDDLGTALAEQPDMLMLGGGNPAHIPEMEAIFVEAWQALQKDQQRFVKILGDYDPPQGDPLFLDALAALLSDRYGWNISRKNIALTSGGQHAFFMLMNLFAGSTELGNKRHIGFPICPEYIGYADIPLESDSFRACRPEFEFHGAQRFKYTLDTRAEFIRDDTAALCVSRPCNPTGNVLTDTEIHFLSEAAKNANIPLIIDNAYGLPFPNIIFNEAQPYWDEHIILTMSLSKLGLPALRTGIVIARQDIIERIAAANTIMSLAPSSVGSALAAYLLEGGRLIDLSKNIIQPFYYAKAQSACQQLESALAGLPCFVHEPEGALFLWLWMKDLPITSQELYERLKARGVLVVPGQHFFPGMDDEWSHKNECIRISYALDNRVVERGLSYIADEVRNLYSK